MNVQQDARRHMVASQLLTGEVLDAQILGALSEVPRELFVPERIQKVAYIDDDLEIAPGRYLLEPRSFARLLQTATISKSDKVLDIGAGTGYGAAVLASLADHVVAVEEQRDLAEKARQALAKLGIQNAEIITSAMSLGYATSAPYDVIFIEGAVQVVPDALLEQLAEGGRLVTVENIATRPGTRVGLGKALMIWRDGGRFYRRHLFDASVSMLPGFERRQSFTF